MNIKSEWKALILILGVFLLCFYLPVGASRFDKSIFEGFYLLKWYAREHVLLCLAPAFFIAGAIAVFVSQASVLKYLGARANKVLAYMVASVSGTILAVCSCTVLPLFAGIYRRGAGLGPAMAFLYSGPAINVLAIALTARVLGLELGIARAVGAILFSIIIGLLMHLIFRKEEAARANDQLAMPEAKATRPLGQTAAYFGAMVTILVFANWGRPAEATGIWTTIFSLKWIITGIAAILFAIILVLWFGLRWWKVMAVAIPTIILAIVFSHQPLIPFGMAILGISLITSTNQGESSEWFEQTWTLTRQMLPLLFAGVLLSGIMLGRPGQEGLIPSGWIASMVGGNSIGANLFAAVTGALMYFATLTEVPILQGLIGNGMGKGPALALLLAGPALSLPSILILSTIIGWRKTLTYVGLVVLMATICGLIFGAIF